MRQGRSLCQVCDRSAMPGAPIPLCKRCIISAYQFADECRKLEETCALCDQPIGVDDPPFRLCPPCANKVHFYVDAMLPARIERVERLRERGEWQAGRTTAPGHVYYIRRGEFVKIGFTTDLRKRMHALLPDEVLAVEPGDYELEADRHLQFQHLRHTGTGREYFTWADDLAEHVAAIVTQHGEPPQLPTLRTRIPPAEPQPRPWPPGWVDDKSA